MDENLLKHIETADIAQLERVVGTIRAETPEWHRAKARLDSLRHAELKRPHWSWAWTFWFVVAGVVIGLFAWLFPRTPAELKSARSASPTPAALSSPSASAPAATEQPSPR